MCTTASRVLCRRSRGPGSKAQETRYPALFTRGLREWAGILGFGTFSIQCAAQPIGISASVPPQDLGFGRRAARLAVPCAFRKEEETRSEFLPFRAPLAERRTSTPGCFRSSRREMHGGENRALQPDILIMLRADSESGNEYSSEFNVEDTTGGTRVPGPFLRHRVLAGAGR